MRFSAIFQLPAMPQQAAAREATLMESAPPQQAPAAAAADLPDDLDARVRLVGEWQLGEAC